jgi:Na+-transporting NADH:ubiquinone oxidoreductase subunit NqrC
MQAEFRAKDRKKALQILALSLIIGVVVAIIAYFVQPK